MYRLRVKIADNEFEAEGDESLVRRDFDLWWAKFASGVSVSVANGAVARTKQVASTADASLDEAKLYVVDGKTKEVSLSVLPQGEEKGPHSVLLLLRGYKVLLQRDEVMVTELKAALKHSGCTVDRVDELTDKLIGNGHINKGGRGKGGKYRITNAGLTEAIRITHALLG